METVIAVVAVVAVLAFVAFKVVRKVDASRPAVTPRPRPGVDRNEP